jgi:hypothetical protein
MKKRLALAFAAACVSLASAQPVSLDVDVEETDVNLYLQQTNPTNRLNPDLERSLELDLDERESLNFDASGEPQLRQHHDFHLLQDMNRIDNPFLHHKVNYDGPGIEL